MALAAAAAMRQQQQQQRSCRWRQWRRGAPAPPFASLHLPHIHHHTGQQQQKKLAVDFSGTWIKDKAASDSMADAVAIMGLGGLLRQAIKLIRGLKITQDGESFTMAVFSVLSWFKVSERYGLDGGEATCRRRDFRRGGHRGRAVVAAPDALELHLEWAEPYGGRGADAFTLHDGGKTLHVDSRITVRGTTCRYRSVYRRAGTGSGKKGAGAGAAAAEETAGEDGGGGGAR